VIDRLTLLSDLQKLVRQLEADLRARCEELSAINSKLQAEYDTAKSAERTAQTFEEWRADTITQLAVGWILNCVFARFLEDNRLVDPPKISGPGDRLNRARDERELYFKRHPTETDREYLLAVFGSLAKLPGTKGIFGAYNAVHQQPTWLSGDAAGQILAFFQKIDANNGVLVHDFTDKGWDTRFLGDLYQDLSEVARKKFALLQTPVFVEEFILDRTLNPAIAEFGLPGFRMIDPACGSGHFLLGSFARLFERWTKQEPATKPRELAQRALDSVHGVDVNPFAVAIAGFRLLLAAMRACGIARLSEAPAFRINLVCGDSLLHAPLRGGQQVLDFELANSDECDHAYRSENLPELKRLLRGGQYHAVVSNPPYIIPKDRQLNARYRKRFESCHKQYSLAVPFMERIVSLASEGGFTGQITASSFANSAFGKKLVRDFLPTYDLTTVIDTSKAYIPGHGTPSVIVFLRARKPVASTVRMVLGTVRDPQVPAEPAQGKVWRMIVENIDRPGTETMYASVRDRPRTELCQHPWILTGGGAADIREKIESSNKALLAEFVLSAGFYQDTHADEAFVQPHEFSRRSGCSYAFRPHVRGRMIRDWSIASSDSILFPYDDAFHLWPSIPNKACWSWFHALRTVLENRVDFSGQNYRNAKRAWFVFHQFPAERAKATRCLVFAATATHSHFALSEGGQHVFNRAAPVIVLKESSNRPLHLGLLGALNSSVGCLLLRQYSKPKGTGGVGRGLTPLAYEQDRQFECSSVLSCPIPAVHPVEYADSMWSLTQRIGDLSPGKCLLAWSQPRSDKSTDTERDSGSTSLRQSVRLCAQQWSHTLSQMVAQQEELDWECYRLYGLIDRELTLSYEPPPLKLGQRAFEILLARKMAAGEAQTTWFERHGSTPITELPREWPDDYRQLVEQRIALIERDANIRLIEQPECKRRWNTEPWESQLERATRVWLLDRLESYFDFDGRMNEAGHPTAKFDIAMVSVAKLADVARNDDEFQQVGELYRDDPGFDVQRLVAELVVAESVPLLPVLRYKPSGLRKLAEWQDTWELQRQEDVLDARAHYTPVNPQHLPADAARNLKRNQISHIQVPPTYDSKDFLDGTYWRLRGKLDVPKERWISFPFCEGDDQTLPIAWAGYDHLQLAKAISAYYVHIQERVGGTGDPRLIPLLTSLLELLTRLKQWHNDLDPEFNMRMGDYFEGFIQGEAHQMDLRLDQIHGWQPPQRATTSRGDQGRTSEA
jgi:type I restriction-modification system DNA methylase subunit